MDRFKAVHLEERLCGVTRVSLKFRDAAGGGKLFNGIDERASDAHAGGGRMDIELIDEAALVQRNKAGWAAANQSDDGQPLFKILRQDFIVIEDRDPGLALRLVIIVRRQLLDRGKPDLGEKREIGGKIRPQRGFRKGARVHRFTVRFAVALITACDRALRATWAVVVPSLLSFSSIPIAASSSRMRSASGQFLAARATLRAFTMFSITLSSARNAAGFQLIQSRKLLVNSPRRFPQEARRVPASGTPSSASL